MSKQERLHFSEIGRIAMLYSDGLPIQDCLVLAQVLDCMSFDDIEKLSRTIMHISNGFFVDSNTKVSDFDKEYERCLEQGRRYAKTGNIRSFFE